MFARVMRVVELHAEPMDIELTEPFGIATGAQIVAQNVAVRVTLEDGTSGWGEAAPFPAVNGETQAHALAGVADARDHVVGADPGAWRAIARALAADGVASSARCAVETALFDALCRAERRPMWRALGGAGTTLETDLTIPTGDAEHAARAAARARLDGFGTLKVKVGGASPELDVARVRAVVTAAPGAALVLDANAALSADEALALLAALGEARTAVALYEQPVARDDLDGLRRVREEAGVPVCADESVRTPEDLALVRAARAADVINVKITKSGLACALDLVDLAARAGLGLMIGGMVESRLAMGVSAALAAGRGDFRFVDLDTPLFMKDEPLEGGWMQRGPHIDLSGIVAGHGVRVAAPGPTR